MDWPYFETREEFNSYVSIELAKNDFNIPLKRAAEDREGWRHRGGCQKPLLQRRLLMMMMKSFSLSREDAQSRSKIKNMTNPASPEQMVIKMVCGGG